MSSSSKANLLSGRKALLLDLDGTVVTYGPGSEDVWPAVFAMTGARGLSRQQVIDAFEVIRRPIWRDPYRQRAERIDMRRVWRHIMAEAMRRLEVHFDQRLVERMAEEFARRLVATVVCLPGAAEALAACRARGLRLGVLTNGDGYIQRGKLAQCRLTEVFDVVAIESELGAGKPDPFVYHHALAQLGCRPDECLMVGDNYEFDVQGPMRAGIDAVWVSRDSAPPPQMEPPVSIVPSLTQFVMSEGLPT